MVNRNNLYAKITCEDESIHSIFEYLDEQYRNGVDVENLKRGFFRRIALTGRAELHPDYCSPIIGELTVSSLTHEQFIEVCKELEKLHVIHEDWNMRPTVLIKPLIY